MRVLGTYARLAAACALAFGLALWTTSRSSNPALFPAVGNEGWHISLIDHGYHAGFGILRADLADAAQGQGLAPLIEVAERFRAYDWLEIGWGDEQFYRATPALDMAGLKLAARALFAPDNPTVLHVVGLTQEPGAVFRHAHVVPIALSQAGSQRLAGYLSATFATGADGRVLEAGRGIYGPSLFFRARPAYGLAHTCNHWVATGLREAGMGLSMFAATLSWGLRQDLAWRSGLGE